MAVDAAGDFVVAWHSSGQDGSLPRIPGQRSDAQGALPGGESCVSVFTTGPSQR